MCNSVPITANFFAKTPIAILAIFLCKLITSYGPMCNFHAFSVNFMHLTPYMYKIVTLKANAKEIVTLKCMWHHICTKPLL